MCLSRIVSVATLGLAFLFVQVAQVRAATLFSQATDGTENGFYSDSNSSFTVFDDFTLGSSSTIQSISWVGGVNNLANSVTGFTISIFNSTIIGCDSGGASCPTGSAIYTANINNNANQSFLTTDSFDFTIYNYAANINFSASFHTEYWISIAANIATGSNWIWESANAGQGDGYSYQTPCPSCLIAVDEAFALSDTPLTATPEPATTTMVGAGLALLVFAARRVKR